MKSNTSTSRSSGTTTSPRPSNRRGTKGEGKLPASTSSSADPCKQPATLPPVFFPPVVIPQGDGSYLVKPGKPIVGEEEIKTTEVMKLLGCSRGQVWYIRNSPLGAKHLRWRFISDKQGKILWNRASVLAYKSALEEVGK